MIREAINMLIEGKSLTSDDASIVMEEIMTGQATPAQFAAFVTALRLKGETAEEISGLASVMREKAIPVKIDSKAIDTCGTGGDKSSTFNISTAAALVAAAAGVKVAKHGNRAMSSRCGSADILEALGIKIELTPAQVAQCIKEVGIGFMFAPAFHPAMKYAAGPRKEIGIRTVFNILGPLTNPARVRAQVIGVSEKSLLERLAVVLHNLGCEHALIVHGEDGIDEITLNGTTCVVELHHGKIEKYSIKPDDFNMKGSDTSKLLGGSAEENAIILRNIFSGQKNPYRDVVILNAAAALMVSGAVRNMKEGVKLAQETIDTGKAGYKLEELVNFTNSLN